MSLLATCYSQFNMANSQQDTSKLFLAFPTIKSEIERTIKVIKAALKTHIFDGIMIGRCTEQGDDLDMADIQRILEATGHPTNIQWCHISSYFNQVELLEYLKKHCQSREWDLSKCYAYMSWWDAMPIVTDPNLKFKLTQHYHCVKSGNHYMKDILRLDRQWEERYGHYQQHYWYSSGDTDNWYDESNPLEGLDTISVDVSLDDEVDYPLPLPGIISTSAPTPKNAEEAWLNARQEYVKETKDKPHTENKDDDHEDDDEDNDEDDDEDIESYSTEVLGEVAFGYLKDMTRDQLIAFIRSHELKE